MKNTSYLALISLFLFCCATRTNNRPYLISTAPTNPRPDWRRNNDELPGWTTLIPATSQAALGIRVPNQGLCHNSPVSGTGRTGILVRFTAPLRGAYQVHAIRMSADQSDGIPIGSAGARVDEAGATVSCYFTVEHGQPIEAVHIVRYELTCPNFQPDCSYDAISVAVTPQVELEGRAVQNNQHRSFFGAYITSFHQ